MCHYVCILHTVCMCASTCQIQHHQHHQMLPFHPPTTTSLHHHSAADKLVSSMPMMMTTTTTSMLPLNVTNRIPPPSLSTHPAWAAVVNEPSSSRATSSLLTPAFAREGGTLTSGLDGVSKDDFGRFERLVVSLLSSR